MGKVGPLLLLFLIYPAAFVALLFLRPRQAEAAARAAGTRIERFLFARSPRAPRLFAWIATALLIGLLGRFGFAIGLCFAALTAPVAASGSLRLLAVAGAGLLVDERFVPWNELSAFSIEPRRARLELWFRDAGRAPLAFHLRDARVGPAREALARHLPELSAGA